MDQFVPCIKKKYKGKLINCEEQWPPSHSNKLVKFRLVEREGGEGGEDVFYHSRWRHTFYDNVRRSPIAYADLFKGTSDGRVRKVFVEGDVGMGKTTLGYSICEDWSCDKLFQEYELILFLPLRQKAVASACSLVELLQFLQPDQGICESVAKQLEEQRGDRVLIIADGWDEIDESKQQEGSFLYQLLFELFPLVSVLVTSRPYNQSVSPRTRLQLNFDRFVEMRGLRKEDVIKFIESEFIISDKEKGCRLLAQLESNPLAESMCSVPLNCALVCHLWRSLEDNLPTTMTQLYTKIILSTILSNIQKKEAFKNVVSLPDFNALPEDLQLSFWQLCKVAFEALERHQIVFSLEELVKKSPLASDEMIPCFGLLQPMETGHEASFNFPQLTIQQFLAALHLVKTPNLILDRHSTINRLHEGSIFSMVWQFLYGMTLCIPKVAKTYQDAHLAAFNLGILHSTWDEYMPRSTFYHCLFEAQNDTIVRRVTWSHSRYRRWDVPFYCQSHTSYDCAAFVHVIANMDTANMELSKLVELDLSDCGIRENQVRQLADILAKKEGLPIKMLNLSGNNLSDECISDLFSRASAAFCSLEHLNLSRNNIGAESLKAILETKPFFRLETLDLSYNPLGDSGLYSFQKVVCSTNTLMSLNLRGSLTYGDAVKNAALITTIVNALPTALSSLDISENNLGVPEALSLAENISKVYIYPYHSYKKLYLNKTNLGNDGVRAFVESLEGMFEIRHLALSGNDIHSSAISALADAIDSKISLASLDVSDNPLGLEGTLAVGRLISDSPCLSSINLSGCQLAIPGSPPHKQATHSPGDLAELTVTDVTKRLREMPKKASTITISLILSGNSFTGEGVNILASLMCLCPHMEKLYCSNCGLTSDDIKQLLDKCSQVKSSTSVLFRNLSFLDLHNNEIDDNGVSLLIDHLPLLFPKLMDRGPGLLNDYIDLRNNPVSSLAKRRLENQVKLLWRESVSFSPSLSHNIRRYWAFHSSPYHDRPSLESPPPSKIRKVGDTMKLLTSTTEQPTAEQPSWPFTQHRGVPSAVPLPWKLPDPMKLHSTTTEQPTAKQPSQPFTHIHDECPLSDDYVKSTIDCKGGTMTGQEIKIHVPENAVHKSVSIQIELQSSLAGPFDIPDDVSLVSPVFKITPHFTFLRPVSLAINHFAYLESEEDCKELILLTSPAERDPKTRRWRLSKHPVRPECSPGSREATVHLTQFSFKALARRIVTGVKDRLGLYIYSATLYCPQRFVPDQSDCQLSRAVFIITVDSETYSKPVKDKIKQKYNLGHSEVEVTKVIFHRPKDRISLQFNDNTDHISASKDHIRRTDLLFALRHDWTADIDVDEYPAYIVLTMKVDSSQCDRLVSSPIRLIGAGEEIQFNWNLIVHNPLVDTSSQSDSMSVAPALILHPDVDLQVSPQEHPPATDDVSLSVPTSHDDDIMVTDDGESGRNEHTQRCEGDVIDYGVIDNTTQLDDNELNAVMREVHPLTATYYELGRELGVPAYELDTLRTEYGTNNSKQALNEVVLKWLRGHSPRTWLALVKAVDSPAGGNNHPRAIEIAHRHKRPK